MSKVTMYPTKVEQPNRNKSSGLKGKCFHAVRRNGTTYKIGCKDQKDPKYHHEWSNAEEICKGKTIQCGRPNTKMCSHKTYYSIKGYRNTCPIAGVSGTYTQPATLRLYFDVLKKGITSNAKINNVSLIFQHRCTGVDVGNGKETVNWGPNFSGGKAYPDRKVLTVKFAGQTKTRNTNPPLSYKFSSIGEPFVFKNVTYKDLSKGYIDIIYGNNLETNPGNIYIKDLKVTIDYDDGVQYIEGTQSSDTLYVSSDSNCRTPITFTVEAGYKQGNKKIQPTKAPKIIQKQITDNITTNLGTTEYTYKNDNKTAVIKFYDTTDKEGTKTVTFNIKNTKKKISFKYKAVKRNKPTISIPSKIERLTKNDKITSITAKNGCTSKITVYNENINTEPIYTFTQFNLSNQENIIKNNDIKEFYKVLAQLSCGFHTLIFKRGNETAKECITQIIEVVPTQYSFKFFNSANKEINSFEAIQNKTSNSTIKIRYIPTKELISNPSFVIKNPTHGKLSNNIPTKDIMGDTTWNNVTQDISVSIGTYHPGQYNLIIQDSAQNCSANNKIFKINITPKHKQHFDSIFVRGEDSTAFNYDYLVALEGDTVEQPVYVETIKLGTSYKDIKICAQETNLIGLTETGTVPITITNNSNNDIKNLFIELNTLIKNEDGKLEVTTQEWFEEEGIFFNFKENFKQYNKDYENIIDIKNLTPDDDFIDEEDVYIHIKKLQANKSIKIKIPFGSGTEKEIYLQLLLFSQPIGLYNQTNCNDTSKIFELIKLQVYDSILTDLSITGQTDLFSTIISPEIGVCPEECFATTDGITYKIKNIDTSNTEGTPKTLIKNDPRLIPYKFVYNGTEYQKDNYNNTGPLTFDIDNNAIKTVNLGGYRIDAEILFNGHEAINIHQYTDFKGEVIFFITIPPTYNGLYTLENILSYITFKFTGDNYYNGFKQKGTVKTNINTGSKKQNAFLNYVNDYSKYSGGQTIPIKMKLTGNILYKKNEITFIPSIKQPGKQDEVKIYYKICNLDNNKGILTTEFKTNDYRLIPNSISKNIYCGVNTNTILKTKLSKIILENKNINRLYFYITNKERENKNIQITIRELKTPKYDMIDYNIDTGTISIIDNNIVWKIDYLDINAHINGYIDFKAETVGYSSMEITMTDFINSLDNIKFGEDSYKCPCRKKNNSSTTENQ